MNKIYLVDFDGTISKTDTIVYLAKKFYPHKEKIWWDKLKSGEYSIKNWIEMFAKEFDIDEKEYLSTLDEIEIDETFSEFIKNKTVCVVSGGFDYNINYILQKHNIEGMKIYANEFKYIDEKKIKINMKYYDKRYNYSAVSKEVIVKYYKEKYDKVVFIGDGLTDIGASMLADKVYAKADTYLEKKLKESDIHFQTFKNFREIEILEGKKDFV